MQEYMKITLGRRRLGYSATYINLILLFIYSFIEHYT